jgi:hypothetical protein
LPPLLELLPPQPAPAEKNSSSMSPNPAMRRLRVGIPTRKIPANSAPLVAANQPKPGGEVTAPDKDRAAVVLTVSVEVPELFATEVGAKEHVGAGVPPPVTAQVRATVPLKPAVEPIVIVEVADAPAVTEAAESAPAAMVKSGVGVAVTVKLTVVEWLRTPEVPVTVMLEVAIGVDAVVAIVSVDVSVVTEAGLKLQVAPVGKPLQLSVTVPVKPCVCDTLTVDVPDCPGPTTAAAVPPTEKSGVETKPGQDVASTPASTEPSPVTRS